MLVYNLLQFLSIILHPKLPCEISSNSAFYHCQEKPIDPSFQQRNECVQFIGELSICMGTQLPALQVWHQPSPLHWYALTVHIYFQIFRHYKKNFYSHVFKMRLQLRKTWLQDDLTYSHVFLGRVFKRGLNPMTIGLRDLWPHFFKRGYRPGPMAAFKTWL